MNGNEKDWWEGGEGYESGWDWYGGPIEEEDKKRSRKLKTFAIQYKTYEGIKSVELDSISERDAIKQLTEEIGTDTREGLFEIISVIEVDYDEG